jgi:hypothetical protein
MKPTNINALRIGKQTALRPPNYKKICSMRKKDREKQKKDAQKKDKEDAIKYKEHVEEVLAMRTSKIYDEYAEKILHDKVCECGTFPCTKLTKCQNCANFKCHIIPGQKSCCWCMDKRGNREVGYKYIDGEGFINVGQINDYYCPHCKNNRE